MEEGMAMDGSILKNKKLQIVFRFLTALAFALFTFYQFILLFALDVSKLGSDNKKYYYVQVENIAAAELDDLQEFDINGTKFYYSALDYVNAVLASNNMTDDQKELATATYFYNKAANAYFPPTA